MARIGRDIAKVLTGLALHETLGHWWLGIWGGHLLPLKIMGIEFTQTFNTYCMIAWPIVLMVLVYFAWLRQERTTPTARVVSVA